MTRRRFLQTCASPGCGELVVSGYCVRHMGERLEERRAADRAIKARSEWRWVYASRRWQALRRQVLAEQPWCAVVECYELSRDVDHKVPLQEGGAPFDRENLSGLCRAHHSAKTADEVRNRYRSSA